MGTLALAPTAAQRAAALNTLTPQQKALVNQATPLAGAQRTAAQKAAVVQYKTALKALPAYQQAAAAKGITLGAVQVPKPPGQVGGAPKSPGAPGGSEPADLIGNAAGSPAFMTGPGGSSPTVKSVMSDPAKLTQLFAAYGITGTLNEQIAQLAPLYMNAGLQQWNTNLAGDNATVAGNPSLQNANPYFGYQALQTLTGQMMAGLQEGDKAFANVQAALGGRSALGMPEWMGANVQSQIANRGGDAYAWLMDPKNSGSSLASFELLMSPDINYTDPSKPLFAAGANPPSLSQLTQGGQAGESAFYRGLSAEELMNIVYPKYDAYYNRGAGNPVPEGMSGFGFGEQTEGSLVGGPFDPGYVPAFWNHPIRSEKGTYALAPQDPGYDGSNRFGIEAPWYVTDPGEPDPANMLYSRWNAYGHPGDPTQNGTIHGGNFMTGPAEFNALTGAGSYAPTDWASTWLGVEPQWLGAYAGTGYDQWTDVPDLGNAPFAGAFDPIQWAAMGRPDMWWNNPQNAPFVEGDEEFFNRYMALMGDPSMGAWAE
jgi:hypothetical protein